MNKPGAHRVFWNYVGFKTNEHAGAANTAANTSNFAKHFMDKHPDLRKESREPQVITYCI